MEIYIHFYQKPKIFCCYCQLSSPDVLIHIKKNRITIPLEYLNFQDIKIKLQDTVLCESIYETVSQLIQRPPGSFSLKLQGKKRQFLRRYRFFRKL